jgi:hypothetical protein
LCSTLRGPSPLFGPRSGHGDLERSVTIVRRAVLVVTPSRAPSRAAREWPAAGCSSQTADKLIATTVGGIGYQPALGMPSLSQRRRRRGRASRQSSQPSAQCCKCNLAHVPIPRASRCAAGPTSGTPWRRTLRTPCTRRASPRWARHRSQHGKVSEQP